jgi:ribosomal protein L40E
MSLFSRLLHGEPDPPKESVCPGCGIPAPPDATECSVCGYDLREIKSDAVDPDRLRTGPPE